MILYAVCFYYFSFQLSSGDASDSICPKGWGIAEYDGKRSHQRLIKTIYGAKIGSIVQDYQEYNVQIRPDEILTKMPISLIYTGYVNYSDGKVNEHPIGYYWQNRADYHAYYSISILIFYTTDLKTQDWRPNGFGFSLRCVAK